MSRYVTHEQIEEVLAAIDGVFKELEKDPPKEVGYEYPVRLALLEATRLNLLSSYDTALRMNALEDAFEKFRAWVGEVAAKKAALNATPKEEVRAREALSKISSLVSAADQAGAFSCMTDGQAMKARKWLLDELAGTIKEGTGA